MEKQVAVIVTDDVTELNKRLSTGYSVYNNFTMNNGHVLFILRKYEQSKLPSRALQAETGTDVRAGYSYTLTTPTLTQEG